MDQSQTWRIVWIVCGILGLLASGARGDEPTGAALQTSPDQQAAGRIVPAWKPFRGWFRKGQPLQDSDSSLSPIREDSAFRLAARADETSQASPEATQPNQREEGGATAEPGGDPGPPRRGRTAISSNPGAVNIITGTGALGRALGLEDRSGVRLGGVWIGDASGVVAGGRQPGKWGLNSLTLVDLNLDTEKLGGWTGGSFGAEFLQYSGQKTNALAGAFPGFDSLDVVPPLVRQELYQLWFRQSLFQDKLIFRVGKSVPTFDFNNVVRPVPIGDPAADVPAVTGLLYTPVFVNPTMLGVIPGYYNSATGITTTVVPRESLYVNYGFYDGNLARGRQTGLEGPHFNGYYFHIGEIGTSFRLGPLKKAGKFGVGVWGQTGRLKTFTGGFDDGAMGVYLFGSQRLWLRKPGVDNSGISGFYQFGANNSDALLARQYVGGGLTAFGLVPGRLEDSFGVGLASTWNTRGDQAGHLFFPDVPKNIPLPLRSNQLMFQAYYQAKVANGMFVQTALTDIPNPGQNDAIPHAFAVTLRFIALF